MGGGLMQLVAYGAQDIYLTGNPQITFFKVVYRRHTNFSMEHIEQTINGISGWNKTITSIISRTGDLLHTINLDWKSTTNTTDVNMRIPHNFGHYMIDWIRLDIGGTEIDKIYGHWMEVNSRLTIPNHSKVIGSYSKQMINTISDPPNTVADPIVAFIDSISSDLSNTIPQNTNFQQMTGAGGVDGVSKSRIKTKSNLPRHLQIPIPFWFCKNPGLALPLIALQYHDIKINIKFKDNYQMTSYDTNGDPKISEDAFSKEIFGSDSGTTDTFKVYCEYIYLDTEERRRFAQVTHEYLIEQVQREEHYVTNGSPNSFRLAFNHPVKELIFCADWGENRDVTNMWPDLQANGTYCGYSSSNSTEFSKDSVGGWLPGIGSDDTTVSLKLNNHDRFSADKPLYYFTRYQAHKHHSGPVQLYSHNPQIVGGEGHYQSGGCSHTQVNNELNRIQDSIGVYSFALKPEEHQPSGSCNFSRIDNCMLSFKNLHLNPSNQDILEFCNQHKLEQEGIAVEETHITVNSGKSNIPPKSTMIIYAINYNVLRIMSGMGGLAYSN
jgi:hypothetical protein